jgi:5-methylcytosine-specific restriction enzyme subunit McrC
MPKNIIYEYQKVINENLETYIKNTPSLQEYFSQNWGEIKAKQYCGIINHNGEDFYILPKIANNNNKQNLNIFTYMLIYAYDINVKNEDFANAQNHQSNNILEAFIQIFAKNLFKELQKGIYKNYINKEENLRVLKGKYLINENIKYNFNNSKIYCSYDEFSEDNTLNQFFLYAIKTLLQYTKNKKLLKMCELVFNEISFKQFDINSLNITFDRLNSRFQNSFEFALLLLKKSIPMFDDGKKSFAFLFDMNLLFEKFVGNIYKDNNPDVIIPKGNKKFGDLSLRPDIINSNEIIDCKYKKLQENESSSRDDKYQMFVYANNYENITTTMLLYPKHIDNIFRDLTLGYNDKKVFLKMRSLNLNCDDISYNEYIKIMQDRVSKL